MRKSEIDSQNQYLIRQQREYRLAADIVAAAWARFDEIQAIAVIGSLAKALWKEIPRFSDFRASRSGTNATMWTWRSGLIRNTGSETCAARPIPPCARPTRLGRP